MLGVAQEQHPARCLLFARWKRLEMTIVYDPINALGCKGVPIAVAVDEHGVVRGTRVRAETLQRDFLAKTFEPAKTKAPADPRFAATLAALEKRATATGTGRAWRDYGDALILRKGASGIAEAMLAYTLAANADPTDGYALFRLGVCYRMRHESPTRKAGDAAEAMKLWNKARQLDKGQYIWRRRIEQYGPKSARPYIFYDWMAEAINEITRRGEKPPTIKPTTRPAPRPSKQGGVPELIPLSFSQPRRLGLPYHMVTVAVYTGHVAAMPPRNVRYSTSGYPCVQCGPVTGENENESHDTVMQYWAAACGDDLDRRHPGRGPKTAPAPAAERA